MVSNSSDASAPQHVPSARETDPLRHVRLEDLDGDGDGQVLDFTTVPPGNYRCMVAEVRPSMTRAGDARWSLRLVVADGPFIGRQAAWDAIAFSQQGKSRVRQVLQALGFPVVGVVEIDPKDVEGREALVKVRPTDGVGVDGSVVRRNIVPHDGWRDLPVEGGASSCFTIDFPGDF